MNTKRNIFIAFILNLTFAIIEFIGGAFTHSVAIMSDAIHDTGDAMSIGIAYFLESVSKKKPDENYTYGYARYSVFGSVITCTILLVGSIFVIYNAIKRLVNPVQVDYDGMLWLAAIGVIINFAAAYFTSGSGSLNQRSVNLHMLEDVLGWVVVLIGAVVMKFTDLWMIDPAMSIGVAVFIIINALKNLKAALDLFLEKVPKGISVNEITEHITDIEGVESIHHLHIWSMDGMNNCATLHVVTDADAAEVKRKIREEMQEHGIQHITLELETTDAICGEEDCHGFESSAPVGHHHHH
ncbi:MAG: cation transporter [Lachnospiraceae bacterium]|nr:cation transporter [Candidatus Minthocola equi]